MQKMIIFVCKKIVKKVFGPEVPYLSAIGALLYLVNNTKADIAFVVNVLVRYSLKPTIRHWNGIE